MTRWSFGAHGRRRQPDRTNLPWWMLSAFVVGYALAGVAWPFVKAWEAVSRHSRSEAPVAATPRRR